jgi:hypothetical protein
MAMANVTSRCKFIYWIFERETCVPKLQLLNHPLTRADDPANSIAAGAISGMIFKSTRGTKPMLISGALVGGIAAVWSVSVTAVNYNGEY